MYRRILVPLDGSELAEQALTHAVPIAKCMGGELHLARVCLSMIYVNALGGGSPDFGEQVYELDRQAAQAYVEKVSQQLTSPDLPVMTAVLEGAVAETLVDYAQTHQIDLIVMSTHGRSGLSRWVFGSVAERVLRGAHCPTLIVRGHDDN